MSTRRQAFSLVELLVVLVVVAVLLGLLLPVIGRVRGNARQVQCASNLRQITTACTARAQSSGGYLPLAGRIGVPAGTSGYGSLPVALNDAGRTRYVYVRAGFADETTPTLEHVAPLPAALQPYLASSAATISAGTLKTWERTSGDEPAVRVFLCPSAARPPDGVSEYPVVMLGVGDLGYLHLWNVRTDYALNEGLLGFDADPAASARRLRGRLAGVRRSAEVVVMGDADTLARNTQLLCWTPPIDVPGPSTLADALPGGPVTAPDFAPDRHRGRANVAFADGHVESLPITPAGLAGAYLVPPAK